MHDEAEWQKCRVRDSLRFLEYPLDSPWLNDPIFVCLLKSSALGALQGRALRVSGTFPDDLAFQIRKERIDLGITLPQGFDPPNRVANRRVITTIVETANNRNGPAAHMVGQIHGNLSIKASGLRVSQPTCWP